MEEARDLVIKSWRLLIWRAWRRAGPRTVPAKNVRAENMVGAFREFKRIWDPHWKMNPGKVVESLFR